MACCARPDEELEAAMRNHHGAPNLQQMTLADFGRQLDAEGLNHALQLIGATGAALDNAARRLKHHMTDRQTIMQILVL